MINRTIMLSLALVAAGCAHKTYTGASYSGTTYSGSDNSNYSQSTTYDETTTKGDGARQLSTQREVSDGTTVYTVITPDAAAATQQGAGARALIGQSENVEIVSP